MKRVILNLFPSFFKQRIVSFIRKRSDRKLLNRVNKAESFRILDEFKSDADKPNRMLCNILLLYHVVEKGLTMPNRRLGFGQKVVLDLVHAVSDYVELFGNDNEQIDVAIGVVKEYWNIHEESNFEFDEDFCSQLKKFLGVYEKDITPIHQPCVSRDEFFRFSHAAFDKFSASRHTVRNFQGEVSVDQVLKAIELAQNAPSACNRQSTRVKLITDKHKIADIFKIQTGNRGFGHLADKLIIITTDMNYWHIKTKNAGFIDGGIFAMNLMYALHYYHIATCPLNANLYPEEDIALRKIIDIPKSENLVLFLAIGGMPESCMLANAHRSCFKNFVKIY